MDVRDKPYDEVMQSLGRAILRPWRVLMSSADSIWITCSSRTGALAGTYGEFVGNPRRDQRGLTNVRSVARWSTLKPTWPMILAWPT